MITLIMIFFLTFSGCKEEETGPTSFEGKVVYADDGSPYLDGILNIASNKNVSTPGSCCVIENRDIPLSDNGEFDAEFSRNDEIDYFDLFIKTTSDSIIGGTVTPIITGSITSVSGLDCSPYDCDNFKPGKMYKDLVIKVPR